MRHILPIACCDSQRTGCRYGRTRVGACVGFRRPIMLGGACDACQKWRCAHRAWMMECRRGNIYIYFPDACGDGSSTCMQVGDSLKVTARCRHSNGQGRRQERTARSPLAGFSRSGERYGLRNFALGHYIVQFASASSTRQRSRWRSRSSAEAYEGRPAQRGDELGRNGAVPAAAWRTLSERQFQAWR